MRFTLHLARELGMSRKRLLKEMDSEELSYWHALYVLEHQERKRAHAEQTAVAGAADAAARAKQTLRGKQ